MNSETHTDLSPSPKTMRTVPFASPASTRNGMSVHVSVRPGAAKLPPGEDVAEEAAQPAAKPKYLPTFSPPIPIKTLIPTVAHPAGHMLNIVGVGRSDRGRKCDIHGNVVKADMIVRLRSKQHLLRNKTTGKNEEYTTYEAVRVTEGVDACKVGFLPKADTNYGPLYDGILCQILKCKKSNDTLASIRRTWHRNCGNAIATIISPLNLEIDVLPIGGKKGNASEEYSDCEVVGVVKSGNR
jgi:hypothetical protein